MALFTEERLRNRVKSQFYEGGYDYINVYSKAKKFLNESVNQQKLFSAQSKIYDIFLSHSSNDAEIVAGLKLELEDLGYSVYVDWIEDPLMNRTSVTKETALILQDRMKNCKSLIYAFSENASNSKWMPWELGYFDALKGTMAVLPISKTNKTSYVGSEYLGIYNYIQIDKIESSNIGALWVHETQSKYIIFNSWLNGSNPIQR